MSGLNPAQQHAVEAGEGPQLILAGAGSGKTRTIVHRIGHLIGTRGVAPHRILAVTFTNKAAAELKARLSDLIGDDGGGVVSGTFHAISLRFLRRYAEHLGYPKSFQVIDADDQKTLVKRLLKGRNIDKETLHPSYLLHWIEHCKHAGLTPEQAPVQMWSNIDMRELYAAYQDELRRLERMDFSDLILNTVELLRHHDGAAAMIRAGFDHVLVDEYQDTNPAQHEWLMLLCREHHNLTVVGDDDQSIYGWRGADVRHILDFERTWPDAGVHRLEENYRSSAAILELANAVIRDNPHRHEKRLRATREGGKTPVWRICNDEYDEARRIAACLKQRHALGIPWTEMAVLYRSNRQSLPIEQLLREEGIPYRVVGGMRFFERMEIKDALAYWALLHRCADSLQLLRICNKPKRGIGAKGAETISRMLAESGLRAPEWLDGIAESGGTGPAAKLAPLAKLITEHRASALEKPDLGLGDLLQACGYTESLKALGELEAESRMENIRALQDFIETSMGEGLLPIDFMDRAALLQSGEEHPEDAAVSLMSLHRAKGLEFDTVILAGVEEGLLPHQRAMDEGEAGIAEERRLLYVGVTRAMNHLLLTSARMRRVFGDINYPLPSRFIAELPKDVLEHDQPEMTTETVSQPDANGLTLGASVRHPTFGEGVVLSLDGAGDATRVSVQFRRAGTKRLMLKYAALELI
ncbi:MAG TPA: UvrD-helicase domain-containing protein [Mariprofundaceae bacterium]|nr:UvrD-helicase domain-containing protein [Mariprofundaceae bacterium]